MSTSVMVANASCRDGEDDKKLRFDKNQADYSARKIKMHLMKKNRNHLGLEDPPAGGRNLESWRERNDTCVSTIWEACEHDPDVLEVANQYLEGKAILPADDPAKEVLSSELLQTLVDRFRGEIGTVIGEDYGRIPFVQNKAGGKGVCWGRSTERYNPEAHKIGTTADRGK